MSALPKEQSSRAPRLLDMAMIALVASFVAIGASVVTAHVMDERRAAARDDALEIAVVDLGGLLTRFIREQEGRGADEASLREATEQFTSAFNAETRRLFLEEGIVVIDSASTAPGPRDLTGEFYAAFF